MITERKNYSATADEWTADNRILNAGDFGTEEDTGKFKIGDGTHHWAELDYAVISGGGNPEEITNGDFNGNADNWNLGAGWTYDNNDIAFVYPGAHQSLLVTQDGALIDGTFYVTTITVGGSIGNINVQLGAGDSHVLNAGTINGTFTSVWSTGNNFKIIINPSADFNGTITNISVKAV